MNQFISYPPQQKGTPYVIARKTNSHTCIIGNARTAGEAKKICRLFSADKDLTCSQAKFILEDLEEDRATPLEEHMELNLKLFI